jgi:hypothetical protein
MKRFSVWVILLFSTVYLYGQEEFIPRSLLFSPKEIAQVQLSKDGEKVYYRKASAPPSTLFVLDGPLFNEEISIELEDPVVHFATSMNDGIAAVVRKDTLQELRFWSFSGRKAIKVDLPAARSIQLIRFSRLLNTKAVVRVEAVKARQSGIYLADLNGGRLKRVLGTRDFRNVFFGELLNPVAALESNEAEGTTLYVRKGSNWEVFREYPFDESMFLGGFNQILSVTPDGNTIYATDNYEKDKSTLISIDIKEGTVNELASDPRSDILPFGAMIDKDQQPVMVSGLFADPNFHFLDASVEKDWKIATEKIGGAPSFVAASANDSTWLLRHLDGGPTEYFLFRRSTGRLKSILVDHPALNEFAMATRRAYSVTTRDGLELPVHVYLPPGSDVNQDGKPDQPLPAILYVHGGPWAGVVHWNSWFHTRNFQLLANRGYMVINTEFRGSTGLGKSFTNAGDLEWGGKMRFDLVDIASWAVDQRMAEPGAIGIWGWSYGGYAVNAALAFSPNSFQAGISMYGISDLDRFLRTPFTDNPIWRNRVGNPNTQEGTDLLQQQSPLRFVEKEAGPPSGQ